MLKLSIIKLYIAPLLLVISILIIGRRLNHGHAYVLIAALLFLPFLDKFWIRPKVSITRYTLATWAACLVFLAVIATVDANLINMILIMIFLVALPEEWFFRGYLLKRLLMKQAGCGERSRFIIANLVSTIAFSVLHGFTREAAVAFEVFIPSLFFGWLYYKTNDLILCIFAHAISNIVFVLFLSERLTLIREYMRQFVHT